MAKRPTFSFEFDTTFSLALQSVEHRIEELANTSQVFHFIRGSFREVNMKMEKTEAPFIVLFTPSGGTAQLKGGWGWDTPKLRIGFFDLVNREAYAEDNMAVGQAMRSAGVQFIKAMNDSGYFEPITSAPYTFYYESFTSHVTGCIFDVTVKQAEGLCV